MLRIKKLVITSTAVAAALLMAGDGYAQGCSGCGQSGFGWSGTVDAGYGYSSGDCGCSSGHAGFGSSDRWGSRQWHHRWDHSRQLHHRVAARNRAWPMPFNCVDRQVYFSVWDPMLTEGWKAEAVLSEIHFDPKTNELNNIGKAKIAGIMKNMPKAQKAVFIQRDIDEQICRDRMDNVKNLVIHWYGDQAAEQIAFTEQYPTTGPGNRIEAINKLYWEGTPDPIIPVASGTGATSDTGQ